MSNTNITTRVETVTPDMAEEMLELNTSNRNISNANLNRIVAALEAGKWELNGEAIKVAEDGTILDGQHRLTACVKAGVPFETLIIEGLPKSTQATMDKGKSRTLSDVLKLEGYGYTSNLAALVRAIMVAEQFGLRYAFAGGSEPGSRIAEGDMLDRVRADNFMVSVSQSNVSSLAKIGVPGRVYLGLFYLFAKLSREDAEYFFSTLLNTEGLNADNPIYSLRVALDRSRNANTRQVDAYWTSAVIIKAWNSFRAGRTSKSIYFRSGGAKPDKFPEIR